MQTALHSISLSSPPSWAEVSELPRGASVEWHIRAGLPDDGEPCAGGNSDKEDDKKLQEGTTEYSKMMAARVGKKLVTDAF